MPVWTSLTEWVEALASAPLTGAGIVLVVTGTLKAARPLGTLPTLRALGIPAIPWLVVGLGAVEIAVGILATGGFRLAIAGTALLYALFTVVVWRLRRLPEPVSCGCLGAETGRPGRDHLVVNALAVVAGIVALLVPFGEQWTFSDWDDFGHVGLALIVAGLMLAVIGGVFRPHDHPRLVGTQPFDGPTPTIEGQHPDGQPVTVHIGHQPTVLAFFSSTCVSCAGLWPDAVRARLGPRRRLVVVTQSPDDERLDKVAALHPDEVTIVMSSAGWRDYQVTAGPWFVVTGEGPPFAFTATDWAAVRATVRAGRRAAPNE